MPYNTTAIPPRKEVTGQTQLPLSRVKKIIAQDQDVGICSNNAAFVICLATEMFVQYIASEGLGMAKLERKPRRNIQYKDLANAVHHQDNLEFLVDIVPRTQPYNKIKAQAAAKRAALSGGIGAAERAAAEAAHAAAAAADEDDAMPGDNGTPTQSLSPQQPKRRSLPNGRKHKDASSGRSSLNGNGNSIANFVSTNNGARIVSEEAADPNDQLQSEMRQARGDGDVDMTG
ncbi:Uu.00g023260.m01.CDS01 [Anthostomella pinea]|uniref:Uu.00g023260.m01.CDS01 n=1 Tax=Anthostomella pinea TaxID=933095 RepID=A0AAI8YNX9_9PEZI|nr:Uu.00g023260.m01.CDS01 [Anthostomella pinea]